ncbi:NERD domain-containing protein [Neobacillus notoginsengisoli]|uniref:NERD domain-containing protein n=2 Tax=Neobacillus notoginsengisoli TaxID=1578198 RepID=A0A417YT63_9BACI|nr:NERD domain-containing protein [Neobacillus notoginsengisoli]
MLFKPRTEDHELLTLGSLNARMALDSGKRQYYLNKKKGYDGEVMFDAYTEKLECECLVLNDLLLKFNNKTFQIDSLLIAERVHQFEVKNFTGDYFYEDKKFYFLSKTEVENPINQLTRSESLLRQLFASLGFNLPIEGRVVFINPDFYLYQAPLDLPILFPTQINRHMQKLNTAPYRMNGKLKALADKLVAQSAQNYLESPYTQLPRYCYEDIKPGMNCMKCQAFSVVLSGKKLGCTVCGFEEKVESAVLRTVFEFKRLFPSEKLTTSRIYEWCGGIVSGKWVHGILERNFKKFNSNRWTYFE